MTVAELIEFLKTQDQGAIVEIMSASQTRHGDISVSKYQFHPSRHAEYTDWRNNPHVKPESPWYNNRYLFLGGDEQGLG
jgi:hypothetical protein